MRDQGAEAGVVPVVGQAPPVEPLAPAAPRMVRPDTRVLALLALGHMVIDINQGSLAPLLPFFKARFVCRTPRPARSCWSRT
jgi:hypothetical protein